MKQHTAQELEGHRIRIACPERIPVPTGRAITVTDLETGEEITNVTTIEMHIVPREVVTARLTLFSIGKLVHAPDGSMSASLKEEKLTVHNPEVELTAFVVE